MTKESATGGKAERAALFHNVRSAYNVGALFRTADGAGISHLYLTGITPTPTDRFGRVQKEINKTALGAEQFVAWEYCKQPSTLLRRLKNEGWTIVGVEQDARAVNYRGYQASRKTLFVFGAEVKGLSKQLRDQCDSLIEIPMRGSKESLNVSVAAGIVLYQFSN